MNLKAIAIDDEPHALEVVKMLAEKVPFLSLDAMFTNSLEALAYLQNHKIDLLFLDINMPDISGIELVNILPKNIPIVFTTAYSEYAVKGFELDAVDYLLKPFSLARFTKACQKALEIKKNQAEEAPSHVFIKTGYEEEKVDLNDIHYIEADGNYMTFYLSNKKLLSRQSISDVLGVLPTDAFIRIHRSYIISKSKIEKISRNSVWLLGIEIPVGSSYESKLLEIRASLGL
ncbi:DNA-binding response regulator [Lacihabitans sp. LS3-19]|uniref:LytR/AlgR family response regulator transcription factor n=1 Tax=Lacihabitans sp. LS3-19 TaxID=2487335 RepID=UPI0020CE30C6|nr:LytTR family DNA-binding domain-containing protein [Lacihabitans sp. LS3-19]MCP9769555.1 DNA-binding response regulator [Lacihabitans sp. LS3-19]